MQTSGTKFQIHLPDNLYVEFQALEGVSKLDLNSYFSRVPFLPVDKPESIEIVKYESGKPYIIAKGSRFGYSVSHTRNVFLIGLNACGEIGVDVEYSQRVVHSRLRSRICSTKENWLPEIQTLQIWTIKEAVLKLTGTGLRTNMNKIQVERINEINFIVHHDNKEISIVSLESDGYWISIAWTLTT